MTAVTRVSDIKRGRSIRDTDGKPRTGSETRRVYENLRRGGIVKTLWANVEHLSNFYGMDIERVEPGRYKLIGEWDGPYYIPVERIVSSLMEPV